MFVREHIQVKEKEKNIINVFTFTCETCWLAKALKYVNGIN